jgi:hypothetical protein
MTAALLTKKTYMYAQHAVNIDVVFRRFVDDFRRLANRLGLTCKENLR